MDLLRDRRVILGGGGALALLLGLGAAFFFVSRDAGPHGPPPASKGGLVVEEGHSDQPLDAAQPLRCFVGGQFVGQMSLGDCAKKNGVATHTVEAGGPAAPPPASPPLPVRTLAPPSTSPIADTGPSAPCWRRDADWSRLPTDLTLNACVQALFAGRCVKGGEIAYGRWGEQTLRLDQGRISISADNRNFRRLVDQGPGCSTPSIPG